MLSNSRIFLALLNTITLICELSSFAISSTSDHPVHKTPCLHDISSPLPVLGIVFITATTVIGIWSSCAAKKRLKALESIYIWILVISTMAVIVFSSFVTVLMPRQSAFEVYQQTAVSGYWLKEYKPALQRAVVNEKDWFGVKNCFVREQVCRVMNNQTDDQKVGYIEVGCCKPPNRCGMVRKNITTWVARPTGLLSEDSECKMFMKVGGDCFDCDSCKAGYLANYQDEWNRYTGLQAGRILLLIFATGLAFYAFRDDQSGDDANVRSKHVGIKL